MYPWDIEDMRSVPAADMPAPTAQPSLADLFQQGGVQVTPGATGAESVRRGSNVPPTARQAQYEGLAGIDEALSEALQDPRSDLGSILAATRMSEPYRQQVAGEVETQRKQEFEAGAPGREMRAKIEGERAAQPLAMERMAEQARLTQQGAQAQARLEHQLAVEKLQDIPMGGTSPLAVYTPRQLAGMSSEQREELYKSSTRMSTMAGWGKTLESLSMLYNSGTWGPPGSPEAVNTLNMHMGIATSQQTGQPLENFIRETIDPRTGKRKLEYRPSGALGLKVGGVSPQITPPPPGAGTRERPGFYGGGSPQQPHPLQTLFGNPAQ